MMVWEMWNAREFERVTGHVPENDDLERVNCPNAHESEQEHYCCGVCTHCGMPRFMCTQDRRYEQV